MKSTTIANLKTLLALLLFATFIPLVTSTASCCYYGCPAGNPSCTNPCTTVPNGGCGPLGSCALAFCHHEPVADFISSATDKGKMELAEEREVKVGPDNLQA